MINLVANRYAKAFLEATEDTQQIPQVLADFSSVVRALREHKKLSEILFSRFISIDVKNKILEDLLKLLKAGDTTKKYLHLLLEKNRMRHLEAVHHKLELLFLERTGVVPLEVSSPHPLKENDRKDVEKKFSGYFNKPVKAYYAVRPELIGEIRVLAFGKTYDGSVFGALKNFEEQTIGGIH